MAHGNANQKPKSKNTSQRKKRDWEELDTEWTDLQTRGATELPIYLKNRAVQCESGLNRPGFKKRCEEILACKPFLTDNAISEALSSTAKNSRGNQLFLSFATAMWRSDMPELSLDDYENGHYSGPTAVRDFISDLRRIRDDLSGLPQQIWPEIPSRLDNLKRKVDAFLQDASSRLMTIDSAEGYFACSGQFNTLLLNELSRKTGSLPIFYASVGRPGSLIFPPARKDADAPPVALGGQAADWRKRMDLPTLVNRLLCFIMGEAAPRKPASNSLNLWENILLLRKALSDRPALLVFDGYTAMGTWLPALRSVLTGDPLSVLLPHLMEDWPEVGKERDVSLPERKTKIIVFSDQHPAEFERFNPRREEWPGKLPAKIVGETFLHQVSTQMFRWKNRDSNDLYRRMKETSQSNQTAITNEDVWAVLQTQIVRGGEKPSVEKNLGAAVHNLLDLLDKEKQGNALLILTLTALSPGGLRYTTLWNIIRQWRKAEHYEASLDTQPSEQRTPYNLFESAEGPDGLPLKAVASIARLLRPLLMEVRDDFIAGLDDSFRRWEYLDPPDKPAEGLNTRLRQVDFRSRVLREQVIAVMNTRVPEHVLARLHRLLAEELLRQHTVALRHRVSNDPLPLDALRAISQFLSHGWLSLVAGPEKEDQGLKPLGRHLPVDPKEVYIHLYTTFFRQLAAGSLHSEFAARIVAVENLQLDLLQVAMNIDRHQKRDGLPFSYRRDNTFQLDITSLLDPEKPQELRLLLDQLISYGRLALHQNRFEELDEVIELAQSNIEGRDNEDCLALGHKIEYLKLQSKRLKQRTADTAVVETLAETEFESRDAITKAIDKAVEVVLSAASAKNRDRILESFTEEVAVSLCSGTALPEVLRHRAELIAVHADLLWVHEEINRPEDPHQIIDLLKSFIGFRIAEHVRKRAFEASLGQSIAAADAHQVRSFVRVALRLAGRIRLSDAAKHLEFPPHDYFVREARRQNDMQTWFYGISHSDRASIHMLEALFYRFEADGQPELAAQALVEAERWMLPSIDRPRARKRLLFERIQVAMAMARNSLNKALETDRGKRDEFETVSKKTRRYLKIAFADLQLLETQKPDEYWKRMQADVSDDLDRLKTDINDILGAVS